MKIKLFIYTFFCLVCFNFNLLADQIFFDADNIKIEDDGNMIFATKGVAKIPSQSIEIEGDKSIYNKLISELTIIDNVKFFDNEKDIYIESDNVIFDQIKNIIYSYGETYIEVENKYEIISDNVVYDRNSMQISSLEYTTVDDADENEFNFDDGFLFDKNEEVISSKRTNIIDNNDNHYFFDNAKINLKTNEIVGKEVIVDFRDSYFGNEKNDPILKGKSTTSDNDKTRIYKAVFSTCSMENKKCRGWEMQSEVFTHDKVNKLFKYKNSWLKVFNYKVFYTPYLSHPDPTVKRKSGFLTPSYKTSNNLGLSINIPYFLASSNSRDFTFNPRIYADNDIIFQTEYREVFEKSNIIADVSFNLDEDEKNRHIFAKMGGEYDEKTSYSLQFQNASSDQYLKIHELKESTELITSNNTMLSYLSMSRDIDQDTNLSTSFKVYENLEKNNSDKYQYIFPDYNFKKNIKIDESYNGKFTFLSSGFQKNYDTNTYEAQVNNDFKFSSIDFISKTGLVSDYSLLLKNYNTYADNSSSYEDENDHELFTFLLMQTELPLKKELNNSTNYLKPKFQLRFSPTNGKDISGESFRINYDSIFSSNRIGRSDMVEEGRSLTVGAEFSKENLLNERILGLNIGTIIKDKKNNQLPSKSKLDQTRSDLVGNLYYRLNDNLNFTYNFSYDRDLDFSNYDAISTTLSANNFVTKFDYITENHELGNSENIKNQTKVSFDEHSLIFNTTKNLIDDFTQFYNFVYEYNTDCLSASFEYNRKFFRSGRLVPEETLNFYIRFIPFVQIWGSADETFGYIKNRN